MEVKEAITAAKEIIEERKKQAKVQAERWGRIKLKQVNKEAALDERKRELLKKCRQKAREFAQDRENVKGIQFLEENGRHFTLSKGYKDATYLYPDGSLKQQQWGMYLGNNYIINITNKDINCFDFDILEEILVLDFKALLVAQILKTGKHRRVKPEDSFKEIFGD